MNEQQTTTVRFDTDSYDSKTFVLPGDGTTMSLEQYNEIAKRMHTEGFYIARVVGAPERIAVRDGNVLVCEIR